MKLIPRIKEPEIQQLIADHLSFTPADFVLKFQKNHAYPIKEIATQIDCYQRAQKKFPTIHKPGLLYSRKAIEQSTGEALINFKKKRYSGTSAADLTGGLGMDSYAFAQSFTQVDYVDCDEKPYQLARHNHQIFGLENVRHHLQTAEDFLSNSDEKIDLIYLDPSRRDEKKRVFLLSDSSPNAIELWDQLRSKAETIVVKLSPLYDLKMLQRELPGLSKILVISVHGEVKEILAEWRSKDADHTEISAIVLDLKGEITFHCSDKEAPNIPVCSTAGDFLMEPDPAIIKAGLSSEVARKYDLQFINHHTDYLTGNTKPMLFPGTCYSIVETLEFKPKKIKKYLADHDLAKVHIHKRDFPLKPEELFKKFGLKMGDQAHLFFTKNAKGGLICLVCQIL